MPMPKRSPEDAAIHRHIGARLRMARREAKLSQSDLAQHFGISFQQVQKYEKGRDRVSAARLHGAAALLDKPLDWFFAGKAESAMDAPGAAAEAL